MGVLQAVGTLTSAVAAVAGIVSAVVVLRIKLEVSELRTYIEKTRGEDQAAMERARREDEDKLRAWVEMHFERAAR